MSSVCPPVSALFHFSTIHATEDGRISFLIAESCSTLSVCVCVDCCIAFPDDRKRHKLLSMMLPKSSLAKQKVYQALLTEHE